MLWLLGWLVTGHKGSAWLPLFACAALLLLLDFLSPVIDRYLSTLPAVLVFLTGMGLALYAASKAGTLAVRVGAAALLIPVAFVVTFYVSVTAFVGSIG
ncbi:hypothetical protein [Deinococcus planocerae]|uniref:hypothetical protein n=1 Tax=Deinococcus planocerae TaxID=1737569 RepID=UPI000C7ECC9F|nr:hypothetical protein [Deinococcus planocerae]